MSKRRTLGQRLLTVYVVLMAVFLVLPVVIVIPSAFSAGSSLTFPPEGFSLRWYRNIGTHHAFIEAFIRSFVIAIGATAISLVVGTMTAITLHRSAVPGAAAIRSMFMTPLVFPAIVLAVGMTLLLSPLGLLRTYTGLLAAHVLITLPYVVKTVSATFSEIDKALAEAALTLGANRWRSFWYVILPLLRPGLIAGGTFAFIISFDEFTISMFLVGSGMMTLPLEMYNYAEFTLDPTLAAISTILIVVTAAAIFVIEKVAGFGDQFA